MAGFSVTKYDGEKEYVSNSKYYEIREGSLLLKTDEEKIIVGYAPGIWHKFERKL